MKTFKKLIITAILTLCIGVMPTIAQNFSGIATYKSASQVQFRFGNGQTEVEITDEMKKQINKQLQKEYTLKFNVTESTWKEVESLGGGPATAQAGGMVLSIGGGENGVLYKNTAEGRYEEEANIFGKPFLVKDELVREEWQLTGETKQIGAYNCQKATYTRVVERRSIAFGGDDVEEGEMQMINDTLTVTAWYTPEIPVTHGPDDYWGLPGLILEVNNGTTTLICDKVTLNPSEGVELEKPAKGKVVSREEFTQMRDEKLKEMQKKFSSGNGTFTIKH